MSVRNNTEEKLTEIAIIDEHTIRDRIYEVRGVKVMLDYDLAEIYGFTTSAFNQQVKRNISRFDEDFRFQLTKEEVLKLSISQNVISIQKQPEAARGTVLLSSGCGRRFVAFHIARTYIFILNP